MFFTFPLPLPPPVLQDYAALLALFHFQKALPLERKLPEPFSSTWLQMLASDKAEKGGTDKDKDKDKGTKPAAGGKPAAGAAAAAGPSASAKAAAGSSGDAAAADLKPAAGGAVDATITPAAAAALPADAVGEGEGEATAVDFSQYPKGGKGTKGAKLVPDVTLDPATADWICDGCVIRCCGRFFHYPLPPNLHRPPPSCGNQNFARLASGVPRLKCFKCQVPRGPNCSLVMNAAGTSESASRRLAAAFHILSHLSLASGPLFVGSVTRRSGCRGRRVGDGGHESRRGDVDVDQSQ